MGQYTWTLQMTGGCASSSLQPERDSVNFLPAFSRPKRLLGVRLRGVAAFLKKQ